MTRYSRPSLNGQLLLGNEAQVRTLTAAETAVRRTGNRITICSWHLSHPSGSQPRGSRRMNSRQTSIHSVRAGRAESSARPSMLRPISSQWRSRT
jgi:hypothetical protein